ncbi:photosystem II protein, Psb35-related [Leptolyngbya sp. FACHB-261]|uniref:photosystem II protein, Psb35-related n=1 Tax=Leptolyngbya sp. FACHB-261 TaxID=2692806 RepID=UPI001687ACCE|nr:hypothetical protein [Leptolyngbya sp. FACHB-261]MBD2099600.1 hypothetical protein [Leptolyngbya sp. FACHB-261]
MTICIALIVVGWAAAAVLGTMTYFLGEQSRPVHLRNWRSPEFHSLAVAVTGREVDYANRASSFRRDAYLGRLTRSVQS